MKKVAITTTSFGVYDLKPIKMLADKGIELVLNPYGRKVTEQEIDELCSDVDGIIAGTEKLAASNLERLKKLKVISRCGTGIDNVDLVKAKELGIKVYTTPDGPTQAVAELTVALMLNIIRFIHVMASDISEGKWNKRMGYLLYGKKVGIIGFGRIGQRVAQLLKPFQCEICYCDPTVPEQLNSYRKVSLDDLLSWADIVTVHVSGSDLVLGEKELATLKKGSWLINVARGCVVNEDALYKHLIAGDIAGACIDVFEREPYHGKLTKLPQVISTPHIGSYAREARIKMEVQAVENLLKGLNI